MLDDDKRQLRLYQERYLADGDLHSDGPGRMRKFRWKNIGILVITFTSKWYNVHVCPVPDDKWKSKPQQAVTEDLAITIIFY